MRHAAGWARKTAGNSVHWGKEPAADCGGLRPVHGNDKTISGMFVDERNNQYCGGLFGRISTQTDGSPVGAEDLTITNATVYVNETGLNECSGAILAGNVMGSDTQYVVFENITVSGSVEVISTNGYNNKDGSSSTTTVSTDGQVEAEVKLPAQVVSDAQETGETITLPMPEVPVTTDRENVPAVTVDLPGGTSAKVEILVEDVTSGTVAVLVKEDGTEEVIKTSVITTNGVAVTLSDGDTVKIVDNSKTFTDIPSNYWGAEGIAFATSRELFTGTGANIFSPDIAMTRGMIVTVLARFEGVGTTTGGIWYDAGAAWTVENGISDASNMDASLTREQLVTMLYRYAQAKGYDTTQGGMAIREYMV